MCYPLILQRKCGFFGNYLLSTESEDVKRAALDFGFKEDYTRPAELAFSLSSVWDAVEHGLKWLEGRGKKTDYVALLHPTSPCLKAKTVKEAFETIIDMAASVDALVSTSVSNPYSWSAAETYPKFQTVLGTQFTIPRLELNNAIYIAKWDRLREEVNGYTLKWTHFTIPADEAIDIDDKADFQIAEAILQWRRTHEKEETE